jgi:hypothetical protein
VVFKVAVFECHGFNCVIVYYVHGNADNWEGDNSESVLESLAISSLVVESCFDSSRRGNFLVVDSGVKGEPFHFRYYFFRQGDNLVDDSGVKGVPFLFRYFFGSFDDFLCAPSCLEDQEYLTNS